MAGELGTWNAVLKTIHEKKIISQLNRKQQFANDLFNKETELPYQGKKISWPVEVQGTESVGFVAEMGTIPDAGNPVIIEATVPISYTYGRIQLSKQSMSASRQSKGAYKRIMDVHMSGLVRDIAHKREFALWHDGTGKLALMSGTGGATWELKGPGGVGTATTNANRYINPNMLLAVVRDTDSDGVADTFVGARRVTSINTDGTDITPSSSLTTVDGDWVVWAANTTGTSIVNTTSANKALPGLLALVDDNTYVTTLQGINRNTYPQFRSRVFAATGAVSADIIQQGLDVADQLSGGDGVMKLACHHSVRRAILRVMEGDRRYTMENLMKPQMGTAAAKAPSKAKITFGGIEIHESYAAPYGILFGLSDSAGFTRWVEEEGQWADEDGSVLRWVDNVDAFQAYYRIFDTQTIDRPNTCVRWDGITADVIAIHIY